MHNEAWTPETDALIARLRSEERMSARAIAALVDRTPAATSARLLKLGIRIHSREEWKAHEVADLSRLLADRSLSVRAVARTLGRTECSVRWKIEDLGIRPERLRAWTRGEDARVLAAAGASERTLRTLAEEIGRSYDALRARQAALGHRTKSVWTEADVARLRELAASGAVLDAVAAGLGKPAGAVRAKAYAVGLRLATGLAASRPWDDASDEALRAHDGTAGGLGRLIDGLGRSERSVRTRLRALGIVAVARPVRAPEIRKAAASRPARVAAPKAKPFPAHAGAARPASAPRVAAASVARYLPSRPRAAARDAGQPEAARLRAGMDDAIARFMSERGVSRGTVDAGEDVVRRIRARGYSVTGSAEAGFVLDGRRAIPDVEGLVAFARDRGIEVPAGAQALETAH